MVMEKTDFKCKSWIQSKLKIIATTSGKHNCGIKKITLETVADNLIVMDLRLAIEDTCYSERVKVYMTKCVSVGKNDSGGKHCCGLQSFGILDRKYFDLHIF